MGREERSESRKGNSERAFGAVFGQFGSALWDMDQHLASPLFTCKPA